MSRYYHDVDIFRPETAITKSERKKARKRNQRIIIQHNCIFCNRSPEEVWITDSHIFQASVYPELAHFLWNRVPMCWKHHNVEFEPLSHEDRIRALIPFVPPAILLEIVRRAKNFSMDLRGDWDSILDSLASDAEEEGLLKSPN